jgi:RNA polymerase sigma-70 factor (ECF subfamily)
MDYPRMSPEELIRACVQEGSEAAWSEFIRRFHPLIAGVAFRIARRWGEDSPQMIEDLVQETYLKLCSQGMEVLRNFRSAHQDAIFGFVKVFTANLVHDHFKASTSEKRGGTVISTSVDEHKSSHSEINPRSNAETLDRELLIKEIDACLQSVVPGPNAQRDRRIFWLYYRVGLPAREIAALPTVGLSIKGVESTLLRLTRQVRERLLPRDEKNSGTCLQEKGIQQAESF